MLVRFNQANSFDRLLDNFFRGDMQPNGFSYWTPAVDIAEQENEYVVKAELPGVSKDDVKITVESNILTIHGEKKQEATVKGDNYQRVERSYGSFQRSFKLPETVKTEKIDASYKDGVLTITLPKAEEAKPKQIEVKVK
ncbi:MAG: Hsp20/alpha crystallin family protein [Ignavibacteriales bacterium]|nr:Hsp20/alpha crystallin family protein [Ignavibacteriales bacterium]